MTSRSKLQRRWGTGRVGAALIAGAFALGGCTFHPGSAAVVNGQSITQGTINDLVLAACNFTKVQREQTGGTTPGSSMAFFRHIFVQNEISFIITNKAATQLDLTVSQAAIAKITSSEQIPPGLSQQDQRVLKKFFSDSAREQLQQATIGAHLKDPSVTNANNVSQNDIQASTKYLKAFTQKQHVVVNPSYGSWTGSTVADTQGSLSVPQSSAAVTWLSLRRTDSNSVEGLPPSQVCG